jgi:hypothetical protein
MIGGLKTIIGNPSSEDQQMPLAIVYDVALDQLWDRHRTARHEKGAVAAK